MNIEQYGKSNTKNVKVDFHVYLRNFALLVNDIFDDQNLLISSNMFIVSVS